MDEGVNLNEFEPSWMTDGGGISGEQDYFPQDDVQDWQIYSPGAQNQTVQDFFPGAINCEPPSGDTSKTYIKATHYVDGEWTCYWIDTTECS